MELRVVYIQEAHPTDGWQVPSNVRDAVEYAQPTEMEGRFELARTCAGRLGLTAPVLVDGMENAADRAFGAWPERLFVVATDGTVAYHGGKGPYGFNPGELREFLSGYLVGREAPGAGSARV